MTDFLAGYAPGTVLIACLVAVCVRILKRTVLKKRPESPLAAFLPFVLGVFFYVVYYFVLALSFDVFLETAGRAVGQGFTVGCLATLLSALTDKYFGGKTSFTEKELVVRRLLEGVFPEAETDDEARRVASLIQNGGEEEKEKVYAELKERLGESAPPEVVLRALSSLIVETVVGTI